MVFQQIDLNFKELPTCSGCDPEDPTTAITDSNVTAECAVNNLNKNKCVLKCSNGGKIFGRSKVKMTCKCPRINGVKTCGWTMFKSQLSSTAIAELACDSGTSEATVAPTSATGGLTFTTAHTSFTTPTGPGDTTAIGVSTAPVQSTTLGDTTAMGQSTAPAGSTPPGDTTAMGGTTAPGASTTQAESTAPAQSTAASTAPASTVASTAASTAASTVASTAAPTAASTIASTAAPTAASTVASTAATTAGGGNGR